ncbi:hypothetical protein FHX74_001280 [Friedmanniella endophytica]|uniref:AAA-like domain-containing protein n=1 Tax=Microlunatus kandeliicorticis TaxID=1759536 RepID=A0A7W3IR52_9ACTN|nr:ATP-binding protein [Microlunatus kandeliicorticis]MBA8793675.1 hypothetical protein [Microlunatus kandeliicorticis]
MKRRSSVDVDPGAVEEIPRPGSRIVRQGRAAHGWLRQRLLAEREVTFPLATHEIAGHLQFTRGGVFAWFLLDGQSWDFRTLEDRRRLWDQQAYRYGQLAASRPEGRPIRLRVSTRPYPSFEFARSLDEETPFPLPQVEGGESWDDYLGYAQRRLQSTGLDQKVVALGVWIAPTPKASVRAELIQGAESPSRDTLALIEQILQVEKVVSGPGFDGRPASAKEMGFLFHRSLSMGIPAPVFAGVGGDRWELEDLAEFTERRVWLSEPYASSVRVLSEIKGNQVGRSVAVLTMGVMPERTWPEDGRDPWMVAGNRLGFPIEWSLSGTLLSARTLSKAIEFEQNRANGIAQHYDEHQITPPPSVGRAIQAAAANLDEVTEGDSRTAARFMGTVRLAVYGASEDEALARARDVVDLYGERLNMPLQHARGQARALREFIPGEPRAQHGYQRRMPVRYLASAMPNVDSALGTPTGPYLGYGIGSARRASRFDMHYGPEVLQTPGLFPIVAEPGGGKSVLIGTLAYNAVRAGQPTIIFDPSGPLARLAELPELAPFSRVLDLTASRPGTLSPYQLVPDPVREAFDEGGVFDQLEYARAARRAAAERQQLMFDVLRMWLPNSTLRLPGTDVMLRDSLRRVAERATNRGLRDTQTNPRWIAEELEEISEKAGTEQQRELARQLVEEIKAAAEFPLGELIMPPHRAPIKDDQVEGATLVVVTMPGLMPPPESVEREYWGSEERYTQPLLHLAAFFASKFIYGRPRDVRKNVFLDENHLMGQWGSGRAFFVRLSRDSRKWNTAIGAASQHPADHLSIGRVDALMGSAFVGRLTKESTAVEACKLIQCPEAYAPVIQSLSPKPRDGQGAAETGEFIWLDPLGRLGKIRIDLDWHPALRAALQTTPGRPRPSVSIAPQPTPFIDPELFDLVPTVPVEEVAA